jgi:mono/diheme cytochrome c family protein
MRDPPAWFRSPSVLVAAGGLVLVVVVELVFGRLSGSPSDATLFFGRFHPLVVHLPIGVLVFVGLAEVATFSPRHRERIDPALGLALPVLLVVTVAAFVLGHFLARSGGYAAHVLLLHRRLEFLAVVGACVSVALFARQAAIETPVARTAYRGALFATLALLSAGAHFGGTVTHGGSYLTEYAPGPIKRLLGESARAPAASASGKGPAKKAAEPLVFADVVQPILEKYCVECHGAKKSKGKLRLDSLDAMLKGGEGGPAIVAGSSASSELVKRVRLPPDDDDRMPPEGKPGPTPEELAVVAFWIDRGAVPNLRVRDTLAPAKARNVLEAALDEAPNVPGAAPSALEARETPKPEASARDEPAKPADEPARDSPAEERRPAEPPLETTPVETPAAAAGVPNGRAVLADKCQKCHGPSKKKGGLRVDSIRALVAGGENGPALVPGDPARSEIIRRVRLPLTDDDHMPPKKEPQLDDAEVAALSAWVRGLSRSAGDTEPKEAPGASKDEAAKTAASGDAPGDGAETSAPSEPPPEPSRAEPARAERDPADDGPPDAELLARVPSRLNLYEEAVRPLLSKRCGKCHTGEKPAARLRIDEYRALVEGGLSGPGIVPRKPNDSFVCQRIGLPATDDDRMPPEGEPPMTADEVALVRFWVERGASPDLSVPSKDVPKGALRAAANYVPASGRGATVRADSGCAACTVGSPSGSPVHAFPLVTLVFGALLFRRGLRDRHPPSSRVKTRFSNPNMAKNAPAFRTGT